MISVVSYKISVPAEHSKESTYGIKGIVKDIKEKLAAGNIRVTTDAEN